MHENMVYFPKFGHIFCTHNFKIIPTGGDFWTASSCISFLINVGIRNKKEMSSITSIRIDDLVQNLFTGIM